MAYQSWSVVHGEQPSASKWNILGTNDSHFYDFLGDTEAWTDFTPSWTLLTVGSGSNLGRYKQIGKTVVVEIKWVFGAGSAVSGSPQFTLPVTPNTGQAGSQLEHCVGVSTLLDSGTTTYLGSARLISATTCQITVSQTSGNYGANSGISSTLPMTWTTNDSIATRIIYEAA